MGTVISTLAPAAPRRCSTLRVSCLYFRAILREFRWTLLALVLVVLAGAILYWITPLPELGGRRPTPLISVYCAWMALLAQPEYSPPATWYLELLCALYPVLGFILIGEGIVRFALLMVSRRQGEKEWMRVMASTYRDHIILCGLGHLGYRVVEQLVASGVNVVAIEKDPNGRFVASGKGLGIPVLIYDMKEDQALIEANIAEARAIVISTNDDMANLEVALDARRLNPSIRVIMRLFDQQIAAKISGALMVDAAFSASALAAPVVAALSLETRVLSSTVIAGVPHVTSEMGVAPGSSLIGRRIDQLEIGYSMRILARALPSGPLQSPPTNATTLESGDTLVVHCRATQLATIAAAARGTAV